MFLKLYFIALPIFFALDIFWIGVVAKNFYNKHIGFLLKENANWAAAIIFYLLFIAGLVVFVIEPSLKNNSTALKTILFGSFFGLVTYSTYDLTNLALTKNWPLIVTVVDLAWGMFISAAISVATCYIASKF